MLFRDPLTVKHYSWQRINWPLALKDTETGLKSRNVWLELSASLFVVALCMAVGASMFPSLTVLPKFAAFGLFFAVPLVLRRAKLSIFHSILSVPMMVFAWILLTRSITAVLLLTWAVPISLMLLGLYLSLEYAISPKDERLWVGLLLGGALVALSATRYHFLQHAAVKSFDCERIANAKRKDTCFKVRAYKSKSDQDCARIVDFQQRTECHRELTYERASYGKSPERCLALQEYNFIDSCLSLQAAWNNQPATCALLSNPSARPSCEQSVAFHAALVSGDSSSCDRLKADRAGQCKRQIGKLQEKEITASDQMLTDEGCDNFNGTLYLCLSERATMRNIRARRLKTEKKKK